MYRAGVHDEVVTRPRVTHEEFNRQQLALEPVALAARGNEVAERVRSAMGQRIDMVESGVRELERGSAVHAAPAAIAHRGAFNRVLVVGGRDGPWTARVGGGVRTKSSVIVPSGQFHLE
jgi:hypothetical protein